MTVKELIDKLQQFKENDIKRFIKGIENVKVGTKYGLKK